MDISFYTAATGAKAQQSKLDVIANNLANVSTAGYKTQNAGFVDLLYGNIRDAETTDSQLKVGSGMRMEKTDIDFTSAGLDMTDGTLDYAISGSGFFAVQDPADNQIYYTRDGAFQESIHKDGKNYLVNGVGDYVLDKDLKKITVGSEPSASPGIFSFKVTDGLLLQGGNLYSPTTKNGQPTVDEDADLVTGYLESSNVEMSEQMAKLIETQRTYSLTLKMVQTSSEQEEVINNLT